MKHLAHAAFAYLCRDVVDAEAGAWSETQVADYMGLEGTWTGLVLCNAAGFNDGDSAAATKRFSEAVTVERLARSSVGQRIGLLSRGSQVRVLSGAPTRFASWPRRDNL